jgi:hypothetical protein
VDFGSATVPEVCGYICDAPQFSQRKGLPAGQWLVAEASSLNVAEEATKPLGVGLAAVRVHEVELRQVPVQVLGGDVVVRPVEGALEL